MADAARLSPALAEVGYTIGISTSAFPNGVDHQEHDVAPRLGPRYQLTPEFGYVSRSIDPPVIWQLGSTSTPPPSNTWEVFVDARNLTNERHATASSTACDAKGQDSANVYPYDRFNVATGVAFRF